MRVFIESGLFGVIAFMWLLTAIIFLSVRVLKKSELAISKIIGGATLSISVGFGIGALFQDIFTPVIPNELLWVLIGLTAAAHRIEYNCPSSK